MKCERQQQSMFDSGCRYCAHMQGEDISNKHNSSLSRKPNPHLSSIMVDEKIHAPCRPDGAHAAMQVTRMNCEFTSPGLLSSRARGRRGSGVCELGGQNRQDNDAYMMEYTTCGTRARECQAGACAGPCRSWHTRGLDHIGRVALLVRPKPTLQALDHQSI